MLSNAERGQGTTTIEGHGYDAKDANGMLLLVINCAWHTAM